MKELTQTSLHPAGNCWQTCVACILDLDLDVMPQQAEYDWRRKKEDGTTEYGPSYHTALNAYLRTHHGLAYVEVTGPNELYACIQVASDAPHMITGRTIRSDAQDGARHVVVGRRGEMIWDPHPSRSGLTEEIRWAFLVPFPKQWQKSWGSKCPCPTCMATICDTSELDALVRTAKSIDAPHVDLSTVFGLDRPLLVGVDDLHAALWNQELPQVSIHYEDATVTLKKQDGGIMATLEIKF
jgi:hypothetical protein